MAATGAPGGFDVSADFIELLEGLMDASNELRSMAEQTYGAMGEDPVTTVTQLMAAVVNGPQVLHRSFASVLLRRYLSHMSNPWVHLPEELRTRAKEQMLFAVGKEADGPTRRRLCHLTAQIATSELTEGTWPELFAFIFGMSRDPNAHIRASAFYLFDKLAEYAQRAVSAFGDKAAPWLDGGMRDSDLDVQVQALKATTSMLVAVDESLDSLYLPLFHLVFSVLEVVVERDELIAQEVLQAMVDVAQLKARFVRPILEPAVQAMLTITNNPDRESDTRKFALEFLLSLAENAGSMARKCSPLASTVFPLAMTFIATTDYDPEWETKEDYPSSYTGEEEEEELVVLGEGAIDRLAVALGGRVVLPVAMELVPAWLSHSDWRMRRAAIIALALVGEGCGAHLRQHLPHLIETMIGKFTDAHVRVRYAAVHCLGQLILDFGERTKKHPRNIQDEYGHVLLPALIGMLDPSQSRRVRGHACSALINFTHPSRCSREHLIGVEAQLMSAVTRVIQECGPSDMEQAVTCVACVAQVLAAEFTPFYGMFMPIAKHILQNCVSREYRALRGRAMEAVAVIGESVGKEVFGADGMAMLQSLIAYQQADNDDDDPQNHYFMQAVLRLAKVFGNDFDPYLPVVLYPLIQAASSKAAVTVSMVGDDEDAHDEADETVSETVVHIRGVGKRRITVNSVAVEDKTTACNLLCQYLESSKAGCLPYIQDIANALIPLVQYPLVDAIRVGALCSLPRILEVAILKDAALAQQLLNAMVEPVGESFDMLGELESQSTTAESFAECCRLAVENGHYGLSLEQVGVILPKMVEAMKQCGARRMDAVRLLKGDQDLDQEAFEEALRNDELEQEFMAACCDAVGMLLQMHHAALLPLLGEHLLPLANAFIESEVPRLISAVVCWYDDLVEHASPGCHPLMKSIVPLLIAHCNNDEPALRQACVFGLGMVVKHGPATLPVPAMDIASALLAVVQQDDAKEEQFLSCTDNAVASLLRVLLFRGRELTAEQRSALTAFILNNSPLENDPLEGRALHEQIVNFIEARAATVMEGGTARRAQLVTILVRMAMLQMQVADPEDAPLNEATIAKLPKTLASLRTEAGPTEWASIVAGVHTSLHAMLNNLLELATA